MASLSKRYREITTANCGMWDTRQMTAIALTQDGQHVISTSRDCSLKVWDLKNGDIFASFSADSSLLTCAVSPDGMTIVAGTALGRMHFLRLEGMS